MGGWRPFAKEPGTELHQLIIGCTMLCLLSAGVLVFWAFDGYRKWAKPRLFYRETSCTVLRKRLSPSGRLYTPEFDVTYLTGERRRNSATTESWNETFSRPYGETFLARFSVDHSYPCWYDPRDPRKVVLERYANPWWQAAGWALACCLAFGAFGFTAARRELSRRRRISRA